MSTTPRQIKEPRPQVPPITIDLEPVLGALVEAANLARRLDGQSVPPVGPGAGQRDPREIDNARELTRLGDLLQTTAGLVRNEVWAARGAFDVLEGLR